MYETLYNIRNYAYRVDDNLENLETFTKNKNIIYKSNNQLDNYIIFKETITENTEK